MQDANSETIIEQKYWQVHLLHPIIRPQIREQMSGPDLHVFTLKFLALKKLFVVRYGFSQFRTI